MLQKYHWKLWRVFAAANTFWATIVLHRQHSLHSLLFRLACQTPTSKHIVGKHVAVTAAHPNLNCHAHTKKNKYNNDCILSAAGVATAPIFLLFQIHKTTAGHFSPSCHADNAPAYVGLLFIRSEARRRKPTNVTEPSGQSPKQIHAAKTCACFQ